MRIQTRSSSKHLTFAAHTPHAISAESVVRSTQISARARIASRSGVGVGVGTASTTAKRLFDDDSPRMSQLKVLVDHQRSEHAPNTAACGAALPGRCCGRAGRPEPLYLRSRGV